MGHFWEELFLAVDCTVLLRVNKPVVRENFGMLMLFCSYSILLWKVTVSHWINCGLCIWSSFRLFYTTCIIRILWKVMLLLVITRDRVLEDWSQIRGEILVDLALALKWPCLALASNRSGLGLCLGLKEAWPWPWFEALVLRTFVVSK